MRRSILVVDDDPDVVATLEFVLDAEGYDIRGTGSAEGALGAMREFQPGIVITDVHLPGMNGLEFLRTLRRAAEPAEVIVITGKEDMETAIAAIRDGAYDFLPKPVNASQLAQLLERCFLDLGAREQPPAAAEAPAPPGALVGTSPAMIEIFKTIGRIAPTRVPVLIRGETGTGKEVVARAIHVHSDYMTEPFVAINCTAIPEQLLESELFGHVKGAFTGAVQDRRGRFELAGSGTIFLDEIGDTSPAFQAKLLRVLQEQEFYPVGSELPRRTRARVIAATHADIEKLVRAGEFREDLYFRLRVVEITVPPLRERPGDIPRLAAHFLAKASRDTRRPTRVIPPDLMRRLKEHRWPGNVRELENAIARAVVLAQGATLQPEHLGIGGGNGSGQVAAPGSLEHAAQEQVVDILERTGGNKRQAARLLGISRPRLDRLISKYDIDIDAFRAAR